MTLLGSRHIFLFYRFSKKDAQFSLPLRYCNDALWRWALIMPSCRGHLVRRGRHEVIYSRNQIRRRATQHSKCLGQVFFECLMLWTCQLLDQEWMYDLSQSIFRILITISLCSVGSWKHHMTQKRQASSPKYVSKSSHPKMRGMSFCFSHKHHSLPTCHITYVHLCIFI